MQMPITNSEDSWNTKSLQKKSGPQDSLRETVAGDIGELKMEDMKSTGGPTAVEKQYTSTVLVKGTPPGTVIVRRRLQQPLKTQTSSAEASEAVVKSITEKKSEQCSTETQVAIGADAPLNQRLQQ